MPLTPEQLRSAREAVRITQQEAAKRLGVSQPYLALLESGRRPLTPQLAVGVVKLYRLAPTALPLSTEELDTADSASLAAAVAALGYPAFRQLRRGRPTNPAVVLLAAIATADLEVRIVETLPWLALRYYDLDWEWLIPEAKLRDVQNRLGFIVALGRELAEKRNAKSAIARLRQAERILDVSRLVREDTLCQSSLSEAERRWLRRIRPLQASHWNLLTDIKAELLPYAA